MDLVKSADKNVRKIQHVERGSMETLPKLICWKFEVGGKDNFSPDISLLIYISFQSLE